jgi:hypothetical protein
MELMDTQKPTMKVNLLAFTFGLIPFPGMTPGEYARQKYDAEYSKRGAVSLTVEIFGIKNNNPICYSMNEPAFTCELRCVSVFIASYTHKNSSTREESFKKLT